MAASFFEIVSTVFYYSCVCSTVFVLNLFQKTFGSSNRRERKQMWKLLLKHLFRKWIQRKTMQKLVNSSKALTHLFIKEPFCQCDKQLVIIIQSNNKYTSLSTITSVSFAQININLSIDYYLPIVMCFRNYHCSFSFYISLYFSRSFLLINTIRRWYDMIDEYQNVYTIHDTVAE